MKTYFKDIKTIAVIFLSLTLFSCQDEQIVPADTISTSTDQNMLKRGRTNLSVSVSGGDIITGCTGSCNTKQDLLWFSNECEATVTISGKTLRLQSISLAFGTDPGDCRIIMQSESETYFGDWKQDPGFSKLTDQGFTYNFTNDITLFPKRKGKNKGLDYTKPFGPIVIGLIEIE